MFVMSKQSQIKITRNNETFYVQYVYHLFYDAFYFIKKSQNFDPKLNELIRTKIKMAR
jgi:hypothetical protein